VYIIESRREVNILLKKHEQRVALLSISLGEKISLPSSSLDKLRLAAENHDCGKYFTPEEILTKPGKLTEDELCKIKDHSADGAFIAAYWGLPDIVVDSIYYHHENYDGTGYPDGLTGKDIPLFSKIIRICDIYDALTEERVYRRGNISHAKAIAIMDEENELGKFDKELYEKFKEGIGGWIKDAETSMGIFSTYNISGRYRAMVREYHGKPKQNLEGLGKVD
jgi:HD-GYP domain-containing protein (c-di-GMP phosphodiesterase class II)